MQWSLKTLLIATAVIPVAFYALARANAFVASCALGVAALAWVALAIASICARGERRAWARGAWIAGTSYGLLLWFLGTEMRFGNHELPTTGALYYLYEAVKTEIKETIGAYCPQRAPRSRQVTSADRQPQFLARQSRSKGRSGSRPPQAMEGMPGMPGMGPSGSSGPPGGAMQGNPAMPMMPGMPMPSTTVTFPHRRDFLVVGHVYCGLLFAMLGGWFGAWLDRQPVESNS